MGVLSKRTCPNCGEALAGVRMPRNARQVLWGGSTCPKCGTESDRRGRPVTKK